MNEAQIRRTFDLISRFVGKKQGITIEFHPDIVPCADPKNKVIRLPNNINAEYIFPALAELVHESGHIRHTTFDVKRLVKDKDEMGILNAIEDIRVDKKNYGLLPNMRGIHETLMKQCAEKSKGKPLPMEFRVLRYIIYWAEGFYGLLDDQKAYEFINKHDLLEKARQLEYDLDYLERGHDKYDDAREKLLEIKDILYKAKGKKGAGGSQDEEGTEEGDSNDGNPGKNTGGKAKAKPGGKSSSGGSGGQSSGGQANQGDGLDIEGASPGGGFSKDNFKIDKNAQHLPDVMSKEALTEQTKANFIDLLKDKEDHVVRYGRKLDTSKLINYGLGDVDEMFSDEVVKKPLRSKVLILLDCSGSMAEPLYDNSCKYETLADAVQDMVDVLVELEETGSDIDWEVRGFDTTYYKFDKYKWRKQYVNAVDGGTDLLQGFNHAQDEMLEDFTITGKKLIIIVTDGEVAPSDIDGILKKMMSKNEDVRLMFVGIGAEPMGRFCRDISGHNIMAKEMADVVILEAITDML